MAIASFEPHEALQADFVSSRDAHENISEQADMFLQAHNVLEADMVLQAELFIYFDVHEDIGTQADMLLQADNVLKADMVQVDMVIKTI